ncbi:hypothetical protein [Natronomonas sp.]|uniref:DNA replication complex subunit Gins51 n=1 Tax=Natronomonas sp. TaxID=2184060 RepID=UPI0026326B02|nr:hypothetical protein [Natronomonas sp.]
MNLDELQSVQARERQSSDLQRLRSSFYREVGEYIEELNEERARIVETADDPFSEPEVRRITDDIETAESTVEAIYERRVGKVVKKASIAAAGMPVEDDGLTAEEAELFEDLVARIESNREAVLAALDGEAPSVSCSIDDPASTSDRPEADEKQGQGPDETTEPPDPPKATDRPDASEGSDDGVAAADLMGTGADGELGASPSPASSTPAEESGSPPTPDEDDAGRPPKGEDGDPPTVSAGGARKAGRTGETRRSGSSGVGSNGDGSNGDGSAGVRRTTVRITADVGEIVGADDRDYDLASEDVVTLPEPNADVLVEKDAAERLE